MILFEYGDSIKFGEAWCRKYECDYLKGKTIMMGPCWFFKNDFNEEDYDKAFEQCPGITLSHGHTKSIYQLFGNNFDKLMDCEHIPGTESDKEMYQKILNEVKAKSATYWGWDIINQSPLYDVWIASNNK
jgi:hypothetical protein